MTDTRSASAPRIFLKCENRRSTRKRGRMLFNYTVITQSFVHRSRYHFFIQNFFLNNTKHVNTIKQHKQNNTF